jgi:hypothetical protein
MKQFVLRACFPLNKPLSRNEASVHAVAGLGSNPQLRVKAAHMLRFDI